MDGWRRGEVSSWNNFHLSCFSARLKMIRLPEPFLVQSKSGPSRNLTAARGLLHTHLTRFFF
uniref:Uncharacterized protein n=1 Tax=Salvator merianae TaxID=96440 RepID=A0A8D0C4W1_SALMN